MTLVTPCVECSVRYARLTIKQYLMWFMRIPYECEHRQPITIMGIEVDEEEAARVSGMAKMPLEYVPLKPANASESSVGEVTAASLEGHIERINQTQRLLSS